jgi:hypothetical protein
MESENAPFMSSCPLYTGSNCMASGTMGIDRFPDYPELEQGSLYCLHNDGSIKKLMDKVSISNGLAWTADNKHMYYIDSLPGRVYGISDLCLVSIVPVSLDCSLL